MGRYIAASTIMVAASFLLIILMVATVVSSDPFPPTVTEPTSVMAIPGKSSITLSWEQPEIGYLTATGFSIYRSIDDVDYTLLEIVGREVFSFEDDTIIVGRTFYYFLRTDSDLGQSINSEKISAAADNEPPDVEIVSPREGNILANKDVEIRLEVHDELNEIISVTYELNEDHPVEVGEVETFQLTDLEDIEYRLVINATDSAGNHATDTVTFHIDTTPPELKIIAPVENEMIDNSRVVIAWETKDASTSVVSTVLSLDSGEFFGIDNMSPYVFERLGSNPYTIRLRVADSVGNKRTVWRNFTVDMDLPTIRILEEEKTVITNGTTYKVIWEGEDPTSDYYFESRFDSDPWVIENKDRSRTLTGLEEGTHRFHVRIIDAIGNVVEDSIAIIVDRTKPVIEIEKVHRSYQGTIILEFYIVEENEVVDSVLYSINGGR